eukprot:g2863.t1
MDEKNKHLQRFFESKLRFDSARSRWCELHSKGLKLLGSVVLPEYVDTKSAQCHPILRSLSALNSSPSTKALDWSIQIDKIKSLLPLFQSCLSDMYDAVRRAKYNAGLCVDVDKVSKSENYSEPSSVVFTPCQLSGGECSIAEQIAFMETECYMLENECQLKESLFAAIVSAGSEALELNELVTVYNQQPFLDESWLFEVKRKILEQQNFLKE